MSLDPKIARSRAQERRGAAQHGARRHVGSGNGDWKNDISSATMLVEYKRTDKRSISIKADDLEDVRINAALTNRSWLLGLELAGRDYVVMDVNDYLELKERADGSA